MQLTTITELIPTGLMDILKKQTNIAKAEIKYIKLSPNEEITDLRLGVEFTTPFNLSQALSLRLALADITDSDDIDIQPFEGCGTLIS